MGLSDQKRHPGNWEEASACKMALLPLTGRSAVGALTRNRSKASETRDWSLSLHFAGCRVGAERVLTPARGAYVQVTDEGRAATKG